MKHAMIMTVHKNFEILRLFIDLFDDERYDFFVLVDKKVKSGNSDIIKKLPDKSKVVFLERKNIFWGSYSQISAYMELLNISTKNNYDYYHFFQGSDFPLKTKDEVYSFFEKNKGREFINIYYSDFSFFKCSFYHFFVNNRFYRKNHFFKAANFLSLKIQKILKIRRNRDITLYHGSALTSLSHDYACYVLSRTDEIKKRFKYTLGADEVFLQTIIYDSPFKEKIYLFEDSVYANCRMIDWKRRDKNSPYTFTDADYYDLINCDDGICFGRKFDEEISFNLVNKIYKYLSDKQKGGNSK